MKFNKEEHFIFEGIEVRGKRNIKVGKFYLFLNNKTYNDLGGFRNALRMFNFSMKDFYIKYYAADEDLKPCAICNKGERIFSNLIDGIEEYCSSQCYNRSEKHRKIISERFVGDDEKKNKSMILRKLTLETKPIEYFDDINEKRLITLYSRYGEDFLSAKAKIQWENKSEEERKAIGQKSVETKIKNGTLNNYLLHHTNKKIILNNKEYSCQGYEDIILEYLINNLSFDVNDVLVNKDVPRINFSGNKSGIYRPDIFIPLLNLIIEVKSNYTFKVEFEKSKYKKQESTIKQGYNHVYFVPTVNSKRSMSDIDKILFSDYLNTTISSQAHYEKVQRLSSEEEYSAIAIGTGSAKAPNIWCVI